MPKNDPKNTHEIAPEGLCLWCWEKNREVEATTDDGELCEQCEQSRQEGQADLLHDMMKEADHE